MKTIKIIVSLGLFCAMLPVNATLRVFACEPEWAELARELGANHVSVYSATTAHQDVHHIQARPSLIAQVRKADLLICTGAELEAGWLPLLLRRAANGQVQAGQSGHFMATEFVEKLDVRTTVDRSMGDVHASGNPHIHLDPRRLTTVAKALTARLETLDTANANFYQAQLEDFLQRWNESLTQWEKQAAPLNGLAVVVHHQDWRYLLDWLSMRAVATLEPRPGLPPNAGHLAELKQTLTEQPAAMILRTAYQEDRPSLWLSKQTGVAAVELPYTVGGNAAVTDLFTLFDDTIRRLLEATE